MERRASWDKGETRSEENTDTATDTALQRRRSPVQLETPSLARKGEKAGSGSRHFLRLGGTESCGGEHHKATCEQQERTLSCGYAANRVCVM